jgi:sugar lactone lactonase YvrE
VRDDGSEMTCVLMRAAALIACILSVAACNTESIPSEYTVEAVLPTGSPFHGVHGLRFDRSGSLYATSVIGQSIFKVDPQSGEIERVIAPPEGMADDLAFAPDGTMVWTAIEDGVLYAKAPSGPIRRVLEGQRGVNAVAFSPSGDRLFASLVFYGDELYELDLSGATSPRLVAERVGGLNAFEVGEDGMIYGPLMFGGRVVRLDPDSGETTVLSADFRSPTALKLDRHGGALVVDGNVVKRIDLATGATTGVVHLPHDADNLAIGADGRVFVSMAAENAIAEIDVEAATLRYLVAPSTLTSPAGIAVGEDAGRSILYVGDLFGGVRRIDAASGALLETPDVPLFQPSYVSVTGDHLLAVSQVFGTVRRLDRHTFEVLDSYTGFAEPAGAVELANGDLLVAEQGTGRLLRVTGAEVMDRAPVAVDLAKPTAIALAAPDVVYVAETGAGRVVRVNLRTENLEVLRENLQRPEGLAVLPDGKIAVVEVGARRIVRIDPVTSSIEVLAGNLPVGLSDGPSLFRGLTATGSALYFTSDVDNTLYRLVSDRP